MIQLRRIRHFYPKGASEVTSSEKPTEPAVEKENIARLFSELEETLELIPASERFNIFYTLGHTDGDYHRNWTGQDVIPFDIDGIVDESGGFDEAAYLDAIFDVLNVDREKCVVVASGNGLQILIHLPQRIEDKSFFRKYRSAYERLCEEIQKSLTDKGLRVDKVDPSSFALNRIMRLPGTENRKPGKEPRLARLLHGSLLPQPFHIAPTSGKDDPLEITEKAQVTEKEMTFFAIDTPAVETGCGFLQWARENGESLTEPQWYAALSVVARLEDGRQRCHSYSQGHRGYSERETDRKIDQALAASGPRTCENIDALWGDCHKCPHFKKVKSPVNLRSATFVSTENSGFHKLGKRGGLEPQYEDLRRYFEREHPYRCHAKSGLVYVWQDAKYSSWSDTELRNYAHDRFDPKPQDRLACEFKQWVNRTNLIDSDWFKNSTASLINFRNGVFSLVTGELKPHSPDYGFLYVLPYDYVAGAECPVFDQFMRDITSGDRQLEELLLEFVGYAICDQSYWLQKSLLLIGEGSNGKSTFLKVVEELSGKENCSHLSLYDLQVETSRAMLEGKLVNICDELPNYNFKNTELLKKLLGGTTTVRKLYHDGFVIENSTKFIFAGNEIPSTNDVSEGLFRRLTIVPFNARFKLGPEEKEIKMADPTLLGRIKDELPGVFNRIVQHYKNLKRRGYLIEAAQSKAELSQYREEVDRVGYWAKENLYWNGSWSDEAPKVELASVFERYVSDCKRGEEKPLPRYHFVKHLKRHVDHWPERYVRQRLGTDRPYILRGVEWRKEHAPKENF